MAPLQFGILCIPFQTLDVIGPIDILSSCSKPYLSAFKDIPGFPADLADGGIDIEFLYIGATMEAIEGTASCKLLPNTTCADCPKLDYLLIGGPWPEFFLNVPPVYANFIQERAKEVKTLFTTCTGAMVAAALGVLDGRTATVNHQFLPTAKELRPQVNWVKDQWVEDGNVWTSGGACAGMDMFAHWVKSNYGQLVAEAGWSALDFEPRDINAKLVPLKNGLRVSNGTVAA